MPKVVREDVDTLNASVTITIEESDYLFRFNEELKKYRDRAQIKGFRRGKTPMSFIKKYVGHSILSDVVNDLLHKELTALMQQEENSILGQPIPSENQAPIEFNMKEMVPYEFKFDLGIAPSFEVQGLDVSNKFEKYAVEIPNKLVEDELEMYRKRLGKQIKVDDKIQEGDELLLTVRELDGKTLKDGGWETEFSISMDAIGDEKTKKALLKKKKGDQITFNVFQLEKDAEVENTKMNLLHIAAADLDTLEVGEMFEGTIEKVTRVIPAELDQAFFDEVFGEGKVSSEKEAKEKLRADHAESYGLQADGLLFRDIQKDLMEKNRAALNLPDAFLKRWLEYSDDQNTKELVEKGYDNFSQSLRWALIRGKLVKQFEIKVTEADIRQGFYDRNKAFMSHIYGANSEMIESFLDYMMRNKEQVDEMADTLIVKQLHGKIKEIITVKDKKISIENFEKVAEQATAESAANQHDHDHDHDHNH